MGLGFGLSYGAGAGADALEEVLKEKRFEMAQRQQAAKEAASANEATRRWNIEQEARSKVAKALEASQAADAERAKAGEAKGAAREAALQRLLSDPTALAGMTPTQRVVALQQSGVHNLPFHEGVETPEEHRAHVGRAADDKWGARKRELDYVEQQRGQRPAGIRGSLRLRPGQDDPALPRGAEDRRNAAPKNETNEVTDAIALIGQIRGDKSLPNATGPIDARGVGMARDLEGVTRVKALHDNLVNKMALAQAGKLKGQGPISNFERDMLSKAATALTLKLGDPDYLSELTKVEGQFQRMLGGGSNGGQEFDYVPGKGLVPKVKK